MGISNSGIYVCANYYPGGNIDGEFLNNIKPLKVLENFSTLDLQKFQKEALEAHNTLRQLHASTPPMEIDSDLTKFAQDYCQRLAQLGRLEHSIQEDRMNIGSINGYSGENLFWSSSKNTNGVGKGATHAWYNEIKNYDFSTGTSPNGETIGHFTQVVWKTSVKVGFGLGVSDFGTFVCANYHPGGNFAGHYIDNVLPLSSSANLLKLSYFLFMMFFIVF